ncbi:tail fiber assembly protein [Pseudomonas fluorescens]|nr:tail fiber assembly protein [Pseudomonas fluorescens]
MCAGLVVTIDGGFKVALPVAPEQEVAPKPSIEQLTMIALAERDRLLALAAIRIAPLQDAVDLKRETPDVLARLKQWKEYRVDLNEVQLQDDFPAAINWPLAPQE